jgi:dynein heavy chain 1
MLPLGITWICKCPTLLILLISNQKFSIGHYVTLYNEKREELEEQQRHLHVGLDKLHNTVSQVEQLRKSLAIQSNKLAAKNAEANEKLQRMVADQQEAEQKKSASIEIKAALAQQDVQIQQRRSEVMAELADAEPAVAEAQVAVSGIKRNHLQEVRGMANPPEAVKLGMESVCTLLGHKIDSWKSIRVVLQAEGFIRSILDYDTAKLTKQVRDYMKKEYLNRPNYNFEAVNRASKACGPLVKWVLAQVRYSEILDKVDPLRKEVQSLEQQARTTKEQESTIIQLVGELEASIARYKDEYAALISEVQAIKGEMDRVQSKVDRSLKLIDSLSSEKERWESESRTFDTEMGTIAGDVLLSAAFLAYGGFFDQQYRELMWQEWTTHLTDANIKFKPELSFPEYLSTADERLRWQSRGLPSDFLCTENAIMLKRFNRYPLIIDPTGQATNFLLNEYKDRKITVTSFLDEAFLKILESALRFGNPLLIQDVEHLDPILNTVLNKELRRTGGRVLIRLGNQDIDFSPSFTVYLSTRDPSVEFSADICSRVTFVNFTMTRGSLQSQSLDQVLKTERPDTDQKRADLAKAQGEFRLRLRTLEKLLLQALNESSGNILDDDKVIDTLETLKREAAEITRKVEETEDVAREVEQVTSEYTPLAQACSAIFFVLEGLSQVNHFYQFSLRFFLDIFDSVLHHNPNLARIKDYAERRRVLLDDLFSMVYARTSRTLLNQDHVILAVLLAQIKLRGREDINEQFEILLDAGEIGADPTPKLDSSAALHRTSENVHRLKALGRHELFQSLEAHVNANNDVWDQFLQSSSPELSVPWIWQEGEEGKPVVTRFYNVLRSFLKLSALPCASCS